MKHCAEIEILQMTFQKVGKRKYTPEKSMATFTLQAEMTQIRLWAAQITWNLFFSLLIWTTFVCGPKSDTHRALSEQSSEFIWHFHHSRWIFVIILSCEAVQITIPPFLALTLKMWLFLLIIALVVVAFPSRMESPRRHRTDSSNA